MSLNQSHGWDCSRVAYLSRHLRALAPAHRRHPDLGWNDDDAVETVPVMLGFINTIRNEVGELEWSHRHAPHELLTSSVQRTSSAPAVMIHDHSVCSVDAIDMIDMMTGPCVSLDPVRREISLPLVTMLPRGSPIKPYTREAMAGWAQDFFKDSIKIVHLHSDVDDTAEAISNIRGSGHSAESKLLAKIAGANSMSVLMRSDSMQSIVITRPSTPEILCVEGKTNAR